MKTVNENALLQQYVFLDTGEEKQLTLHLAEPGSSDTRPLWTTSDVKVVSVDANGVITGQGTGTAVVFAMVGAKRLSVFVGVGRTPAEPIYPVLPSRYIYRGGQNGHNGESVLSPRIVEAKIAIAGDILCGSAVQLAAFRNSGTAGQIGGRFDFSDSFGYASSVVENSDFAFGTFVGTLSHKAPYTMEVPLLGGRQNRNTPASFLEALRFVGFDFLICDYNQTVPELEAESASVAFASDGNVSDELRTHASETAAQLHRFQLGGFDTLFGSVKTASAMINSIRFRFVYADESFADDAFSEKLKEAFAETSEFTVVIAKWRADADESAVRVFAERLMHLGADYIIGRGDNPVRGYEVLTTGGHNVPVVYSLGDFYNANGTGLPGGEGAVLYLTVAKNRRNRGEGARENRGFLRSEEYVPVAVFDSFQNVRYPVLPVLPEFMNGIDTPAAQKARESVRRSLMSKNPDVAELHMRGDDIAAATFKFQLCGMPFLTKAFSEEEADTELLGLSVLSLFKGEVSPAVQSLASGEVYADAGVRHNILGDVAEYCRNKRADCFVFDLYYTAAAAICTAGGSGELYTLNDGFRATKFYSRLLAKAAPPVASEIKPASSRGFWKNAMSAFISNLLELYSPSEIVLVRVKPAVLYSTGSSAQPQVRLIRNNARQNEQLYAFLHELEEYFLARVNCGVVDITESFFRLQSAGGDVLDFDSYFYSQLRSTLTDFATGIGPGSDRQIGHSGGKIRYDVIDADIWARRFLYYYDSIRANDLFDIVLSGNTAADILARYTSKDFIKIYYDKFVDIRRREFVTLESVLTDYCGISGGKPVGLFAEGVSAVWAVLSETYGNLTDSTAVSGEAALFGSEFSVVFDLNFEIVELLIPVVKRKLAEWGAGAHELVTYGNVKFYWKALCFYYRTCDLKATIEAIRTHSRADAPISVDIWGSDVTAACLRRGAVSSDYSSGCEKLWISNYFRHTPFFFAFDVPVQLERSVIENSPEFAESPEFYTYVTNMMYRFVPASIDAMEYNAGAGGASGEKGWMLVDFADIILPLCVYKGQIFTNSLELRQTEFYETLAQAGELVYTTALELGEVAVMTALRRMTDLLINRYGSNIILTKVKLKSEYRSISGEIKSFSEDSGQLYGDYAEDLFVKISEYQSLITKCEEFFRTETDCYVIDLADFFQADENYPIGGAGPVNYEKMYYYNSSYYIGRITNSQPNLKEFETLNSLLEAETIIS